MNADTQRWLRGLNLKERLSFLSESPAGESTNSTALRRLETWKSQPPFHDHAIFLKRLASDGITESDLLSLLDYGPTSTYNNQNRPTPWMQIAQNSIKLHSSLPETAFVRAGDSATAFLAMFAPLIRSATFRLSERLKETSRLDNTKIVENVDLIDILYRNVPRRLASMISPTGVLELQVAKVSSQLQGSNSKDNFQHFIRIASSLEKTLSIWEEYPVLLRLTTLWLEQWIDISQDFVTRLCRDAELIAAKIFNGTPLGKLKDISWGAGDRHRGGESVAIVEFSSGKKIVYKPRSLALDAHFKLLAEWIHINSGISIRSPLVLDRGNYGWSEHIEQTPCSSQKELRSFYHNSGCLLALFYILDATDFHNENLIASGTHLVPVDLETIFSAGPLKESVRQNYSPAELAILDSVLRMGMLPHRQWTADRSDSVEMSGIGGLKGQLSLHSVPLWEKGGTDEMKLVRKRLGMTVAKNLPKSDVSPSEFKKNIIDGFELMYRFAMKHSPELKEKIENLFSNDKIRIIFRNTGFYTLILNESFHPNLMRDALDRDRHFDRLWFGIKYTLLPDKMPLLFDSERDALWRGDVPYFEAEINSNDLLTCNGSRLQAFFDHSPLDATRKTLLNLSNDDLKRQSWIIETSLSTLTQKRGAKKKTNTNITKELQHDDLVNGALKVGRRIEELAFTRSGAASWIGLTLVNERNWDLHPLGLDLYSGVPGIVLFLAYLHYVTQDHRYKKLAEAGLINIRSQVKRVRRDLKTVGAFEGWAGLIYLYNHLFHLWKDSALLEEIDEFIDITNICIDSDQALDVIGGAAGAILVLTANQVGKTEDLLVKAGRLLVSRAEATRTGCCWRVQVSPDQPLTGFSHGAAGFALSLMVLSERLSDAHFRELALDALRFENSLFSQIECNWPDLRGLPKGDKATFMTAWCHGSPGIGLSRLRLAKYLGIEAVENDINSAIRNTLARGFGGSHCLCHGDLGNLDFLLEASMNTKWSTLRSSINKRLALVAASVQRGRWLSGVPQGTETPGLMNGLAGIGYGLLRFAAPSEVPSVLGLDPPRSLGQPAQAI